MFTLEILVGQNIERGNRYSICILGTLEVSGSQRLVE